MSSLAASNVANSVNLASRVSSSLGEDIVQELATSVRSSAVKQAVNEILEEENEEADFAQLDWYAEVVADEKAREAVESVVTRAAESGRISQEEKEEILEGLREPDYSALGARPKVPSALGARPRVPLPTPRVPLPMAQPRASTPPPTRMLTEDGERDIERLLREIQKPEESLSNLERIQYRVFRCLGILN